MASEKNPIAEYLSEKTAGFGRAALSGGLKGLQETFTPEALGKGLGQGALGAGGALAVGLTAGFAAKAYDAATKAHDFKSMLEGNPDLAAKHEENPRLFNQMFSTLRTFNPAFSKDPVVAGSYMRQMVEDPAHAGSLAVEALGHRDKVRPSLGESVSRAALGGRKK